MTEKPKVKPSRPFWRLTIPLWLFLIISIILVISTYFASQEEPYFITVSATPQFFGYSSPDYTYIEPLGSATPMGSSEIELTVHANLSLNTIMCQDLERTNEGQFAFRMFLQSGMDLFRIDEDGKNFCRLTNNTGNDDYPSWSPDGEHIAYVSIDNVYGLYLMNADGSQIELLHSGGTAYSYPSWSPDGRYIVFQATINEVFDIYRLEVATNDVINLTNQERLDNMPVYSPDGQYIALVSDRTFNPHIDTNTLAQAWNYEIYMMNSDGTNARRLTVNDNPEQFPSFSPDSTQITFSYRGSIMVMNVDGSNLTELTRGNNPIWLPDGRIAYVNTILRSIQSDGSNDGVLVGTIPLFGSGIDQISYTSPR